MNRRPSPRPRARRAHGSRTALVGVLALALLLTAAYVVTQFGWLAPGPGAAPGGFEAGGVAVETLRPTSTSPVTLRDELTAIPWDSLPAEARETIHLIDRGGPFPYRQDGTVFQNRERLLPAQASGYYREYTVKTPGASDRGARRIVAGAQGELYYTADHYASFKRVVR